MLKASREGGGLSNALNTFYLRLYGVGHMVKDHSDSERGNPLPPHRLLFLINSKVFFMHHATDRIIHATAFVTPFVEHWLEREIYIYIYIYIWGTKIFSVLRACMGFNLAMMFVATYIHFLCSQSWNKVNTNMALFTSVVFVTRNRFDCPFHCLENDETVIPQDEMVCTLFIMNTNCKSR